MSYLQTGSSRSTVPTDRRVKMTVTPDKAKQWLELNTRNRPLNEKLVAIYASDMKAGRWQYNGDAIRFDYNGNLIDGQHRLKACVESGVPFTTDVIGGLEPKAIQTIDIGCVRNASHIAHMYGVKNATNACAIAKLYLIHKKNGLGSINYPEKRPSKTEIVEAAIKIPGIQDAILRAAQVGSKIASPRILGVCYLIFSEQNRVAADRFFNDLAYGTNLRSDSPVYLLRERLLANNRSKYKIPEIEILALFFKAWAAYRDGRPMRRLAWSVTEDFPRID